MTIVNGIECELIKMTTVGKVTHALFMTETGEYMIAIYPFLF